MQAIIRFLQENPVRLPTTIGLDGKPEVRPFHFMPEDDGKSWHCTGNRKDAYAGLQQQPYIELPTASEKPDWPRLSGKAVFGKHKDRKQHHGTKRHDCPNPFRYGRQSRFRSVLSG